MQINFFLDTVCGWCYVGNERLNQALDQLNLSKNIVNYLPFQLNPSMPPEGMDREEYIKYKFGSFINAKPMYDNMIIHGEQENLQIKLDKIKRTPNTTKSHLLIEFARKKNIESKLIKDLFNIYFTKGKDIGNDDVLLSLAKKNNLNLNEVSNYLNNDENQNKMKQHDIKIKKSGVTAVPFYIFNDEVSISGAQSVKKITDTISNICNEKK